VRVDGNVFLRLKCQVKGYWTRIDAILRETVLQSILPKG
jgi:uncharacterized protein (DUF4415 family)